MPIHLGAPRAWLRNADRLGRLNPLLIEPRRSIESYDPGDATAWTKSTVRDSRDVGRFYRFALGHHWQSHCERRPFAFSTRDIEFTPR